MVTSNDRGHNAADSSAGSATGPAFAPGVILLGIDGASHTEPAVQWALGLTERCGSRLVAVHVKDPYLKRFSSEIYAQGRRQYREHVDAGLQADAETTVRSFTRAASARGLSFEIVIREGDPVDELLAAASESNCDLMIIGKKQRPGLHRWRSGNLAARLRAKLGTVPLLVVPHPG